MIKMKDFNCLTLLNKIQQGDCTDKSVSAVIFLHVLLQKLTNWTLNQFAFRFKLIKSFVTKETCYQVLRYH